jgi:hypothetical protein
MCSLLCYLRQATLLMPPFFLLVIARKIEPEASELPIHQTELAGKPMTARGR